MGRNGHWTGEKEPFFTDPGKKVNAHIYARIVFCFSKTEKILVIQSFCHSITPMF